MKPSLEVFADVLCPFAHVGLQRASAAVEQMQKGVMIHVRAWPLEWVNDSLLDGRSVAEKAEALRRDLHVDSFAGLDVNNWPSSTIGALNLTALAYELNPDLGLSTALHVRSAVFESGLDVSDPGVLGELAEQLGIEVSPSAFAEPHASITKDYEEGQALGVDGSPTFIVDSKHFFCPSLEISKTDSGAVGASFDTEGFSKMIAAIEVS